MKYLQGCHALVTGASSGLGEEFSRQIAPHAASLILVARREDRLIALASKLQESHPRVEIHTLPLDLSLSDSSDRLLDFLTARNHRLSLLVNNAGLGDHGDFASGDWLRIQAMLDLNIVALTRLTHSLLQSGRFRGPAAILNVSSVASLLPLPGLAVYAATKAYVTSLSEALAMELRPHGITVSALCPGPVPTEFQATATRPGGDTGFFVAPSFLTESPATVVREGLLGLSRARPRVVPGLAMGFAAALAVSIPLILLRAILQTRVSKIP